STSGRGRRRACRSPRRDVASLVARVAVRDDLVTAARVVREARAHEIEALPRGVVARAGAAVVERRAHALGDRALDVALAVERHRRGDPREAEATRAAEGERGAARRVERVPDLGANTREA